jgi:uncharacterized membrane protein
MTVKRTLVIVLILTLAGLAFSLWALPQLPEMVPSHWNAAGEVDDWMPRTTNALLLPGIMLVMGLLLVFIPNIDPLRQNVERFRTTYNWFIVGFSLYLLFIHVAITLAGLGIQFNMTHAIIPAVAILFFGIGIMMEKAQPNWFIGVRTPWTLSSPSVWQKTHHLGALLFKITAGWMLVSLLFPPEVGIILIMISIFLTAIVTVVYSYFAFRAEQKQ